MGPLVVATLVCFARLWYHHRPVSVLFFVFFSPLSQLTHLRPIGEVHDKPELHPSTACASRSDCTFGVCDPSRVFEGKFCFIFSVAF